VKITQERLQQIIKEEIQTLSEGNPLSGIEDSSRDALGTAQEKFVNAIRPYVKIMIENARHKGDDPNSSRLFDDIVAAAQVAVTVAATIAVDEALDEA
jgi:hypothetical protein